MRIHRITNLDIPELQPYRTLRRSKEQYEKGLFIAEGDKVVTRLFRSGLTVRSLLLTDEWFERIRPLMEELSSPPEVFVGPRPVVEEIVGYNLHQGIMALGEIPAEPTLPGILASASRPVVLLAIDDLVNAENVGMIVRNARAFSVTALLVGETSSSPYLRRAVRNSLGAVFSVPVVHSIDLAGMLRSLSAEQNVSVLAAEPHRQGTPVNDQDLSGDVCIVVGSEDKGIRATVLESCTRTIEIPMVQGFDSLNVANAAAVCLYEVQRQRRR